MINATGWALYNGYGLINIYCRNGVSICLQKDLYSDLATDEAQLLQLDGMLQNFTVTVDESRESHEYYNKIFVDEQYDLEYSNAQMNLTNMKQTGDFIKYVWSNVARKVSVTLVFFENLALSYRATKINRSCLFLSKFENKTRIF